MNNHSVPSYISKYCGMSMFYWAFGTYILSMSEDKVIPRLMSVVLTKQSFHVRVPFLFPITLLFFSSFWCVNLPFSCLLINQGLGSYIRDVMVQTQLFLIELQQEHLGRTESADTVWHAHFISHITRSLSSFPVEGAKIKIYFYIL